MPRSLAPLLLCSVLVSAAPCLGAQPGTARRASNNAVYLVVRSEDGGMSHSVNMGLERLLNSGIPVSVSVMWGTPWYQETVDILRRHPDAAVGVHLTLNSEEALHASDPDLQQVEAERLAKEYGLEMWQYFGEGNDSPQHDVPPTAKADTLVALVNRLDSRFNPLVTHVGIDNAELGALIDMNTDGGLAEMSRNRQGELDALTAGRFRDAVHARNVRLITYRQLIEMQGLSSMRRPGGGG